MEKSSIRDMEMSNTSLQLRGVRERGPGNYKPPNIKDRFLLPRFCTQLFGENIADAILRGERQYLRPKRLLFRPGFSDCF